MEKSVEIMKGDLKFSEKESRDIESKVKEIVDYAFFRSDTKLIKELITKNQLTLCLTYYGEIYLWLIDGSSNILLNIKTGDIIDSKYEKNLNKIFSVKNKGGVGK